MEFRNFTLALSTICVFLQCIANANASSRLQKKVDFLEHQQEFKFSEIEGDIEYIREQLAKLNASEGVCPCAHSEQKLISSGRQMNKAEFDVNIIKEAFRKEKTQNMAIMSQFEKLMDGASMRESQRAKFVNASIQSLNDSYTRLESSVKQSNSELSRRLDSGHSLINEVTEQLNSLKTRENSNKVMSDDILRRVVAIETQLNELNRVSCFYPWTSSDGFCYRVITRDALPASNKVGFERAREACVSLGGKLAEPRTKKQMETIINATIEKDLILYIGIIRGQSGWVRLSDGKPQSPDLSWVKGEPNNHDGQEDCVDVFKLGFNDLRCHATHTGAMCEKLFP